MTDQTNTPVATSPKQRKPRGSTATIAEVAANHLPVPTEQTSESKDAESKDETLTSLVKASDEEFAKREDALDSFLADLAPALRNDVRKEHKAFISDIRAAAGKAVSAMSHLFSISKLLDAAQYTAYIKAVVATGQVTAGTMYTFTEKIKVFMTLKLSNGAEMPTSVQQSIMSYSNGDSVVVRQELTEDERKAFKAAHPGTKVPRGKYVPSKYFVQAVETIEAPDKWTPDTSDSFGGRVIRLASKLRGKDRSGKDTDGTKGDDRNTLRLGNAVDALEKLIIGESVDGESKGRINFKDADLGHDAFIDCAESIVQAVITRLPLVQCNELYESIDEIFSQAIDKMKASQPKGKAA